MRGALETQEQAFRPLSRQRYGERRPEIKIDPSTKFSGKKENLPNFIFSMETYLQAKQITEDEDRIPFLISCLEGEALTWWRGLKGEVRTWEDAIPRLRLNCGDH